MEWLSEINVMLSAIGLPGVVIVLWAVMPVIILSTFTAIAIALIKRSKENEKLKAENEKQKAENEKILATQIGRMADSITILSAQIQNPPLNTEDAIDYYYLVMNSHVMKKLRYLGGILEINSIQERSEQIKKNIDKEFGTITMQECHKLSKKTTCAGDMGNIVQEVMDWKEYLFEIHYIFFRPVAPELSDLKKREIDHLKIKDIETHLYSVIDKIAEVIRERGVHN